MTTREEEIQHLKAEADTLQRRIWLLDEQIARRGAVVEPHVVIDKQDAEARLAEIRKRIAQLDASHVAADAPYLGLLTFQEIDAERFFGRETLIDRMVDKLRQASFLAVLGPSGSGKSSVVRAGLIPRLKAGALPCSERWIYCPPLRPGPRPLNSLASLLVNMPGGAALGSLFDLQERMASRDDTLVVAADGLRNGDPDMRLLLLIDQAEELWTLAPTDSEAHAAFVAQQQGPFIRQILTTVQMLDSPVLLLFTMRADFLHRAAENPILAHAIAEHDLIVSPLTEDELRDAIFRPAESAGGSFESGLVDALIEQSIGRPGALPLLEYTLLELWKRRRADGVLTWEAFKELGGVEGALAARADAILAVHYPSPEQQDQLRKLLVQLVQPAEDAADTRRRVRLVDLAPAGSDPTVVQALLKPLADERLLTTGYDPDSGAETVELAHEALIHAWPTFRGWIEVARDDLRFQIQLDEAAREWTASGNSDDFLWSGLRLANAEVWVARAAPQLNAHDQRFLEASRFAEEARRQATEHSRLERERLLEARADAEARNAATERRTASRLRFLLSFGAVLLVLAVGLYFYARGQTQQANGARVAAEAQLYAGESLFEGVHDNIDISILLAAASTYRNNILTPLANRAIREVVQRSVPNRALQGHTHNVRSVIWSPDGKQLATASDDQSIKIWDVASGKESITLQGHTEDVNSVAWSPDGNQLASASADQTVKIWDVTSGKELITLQGHTDKVNSVAWSPDGKQLATASADQTVKIWDVTSGRELSTLQGHSDKVNSVAWSSDGKQLATASADQTVKIWDVTSGKELATLQGHTNDVNSVAWSPDDKQLASASDDLTTKIWDVTSGKELTTLQGHTNDVNSVAWSPDGKQLASASADQTIKIWDLASGEELMTLQGHTEDVNSVAWSLDGKQLASGSDDRTAKIWDVASGGGLMTLQGHTEDVNSVAWSPDSKQLASASADQTVKIWDVTSGKELKTLQGHTNDVNSITWSPDGKQLATASDDWTVKIWDVASGKELKTLQGHTNDVNSVAWSPDGKQLATASADKTVKIWDVTSGKSLITLKGHTQSVRSVAWNPDGKQLATASFDNTAKIWDVRSGRESITLTGHIFEVWSVAWSPNGKQVATASTDRSVKIWDVTSGNALNTLVGHANGVRSVAWSPDGALVATASRDRSAKIWEVASGKLLTTLQGHASYVYSVAWSPDGKQLATASFDNTAKIWIVDINPIIAELTRRVCLRYSDGEIRGAIPSWRGCDAELAAVKDDLAEYDRLRPPRP